MSDWESLNIMDDADIKQQDASHCNQRTTKKVINNTQELYKTQWTTSNRKITVLINRTNVMPAQIRLVQIAKRLSSIKTIKPGIQNIYPNATLAHSMCYKYSVAPANTGLIQHDLWHKLKAVAMFLGFEI